MHLSKSLLFLCCVLGCTAVLAEPKAPPPLSNPLNQQIRMNIPKDMQHIDQAVLYVLGATPYKLALGYPASNSAAIIAMQPIPPAAFEGNVMTIAESLMMLIGDDNRLIIDSINHLISFEYIPKQDQLKLEATI